MIEAAESKKWKHLAAGEKTLFVVKLMIFIVTFGFAFPLLLND